MSESEPIDLSQLQNINLRPDWVEDLQKRDPAAGEVVWGRAPDSGGRGRFGRDDERGGGGGRPPFGRDNRGGGGGFRQDERRGPGGPPGQNRGPRPGGNFGGGGGPGQDRGPRPGGNFGGGGGPGQDRGPRPGGNFGGGGGPGQGRGPRPGGNFGGGGGPGQGRGPRPEGGGRPPFQERGGEHGERRGGGGGGGRFGRDDRGGRPSFHRHDDRPAHAPLPGWAVKLYAEPRALDAITRQIKASGRAFPVFELGRLFLAERDRYVAHFFRKSPPPAPRGPKGAPEEAPEAGPQQEGPEQLFQCTADDSLWTSREEAVRHALHGGVLEKYYRTETVTVDPPKGIFTAIAMCGFSGAPLGPPNHHAYQSNVARIHRERFANLPIDRYKSRIQIQKDEAAVAKWMESQTSVTQYVPLQTEEGVEPVPFKTTAEMEAHFLKNYADRIVRPVREAKVSGNIPGKLLARGLLDLLRMEVESQQRFPMQLVQDLCRDLEKQHLKFFKRDRKATYVSRSRPHYLENEDHLSPRIRSIVGIVRANPGITYGTLVSTLAPHVEPVVTGDAGTPAEAAVPVEAAPAAAAAEADSAPVEAVSSAAQQAVITGESPPPVTEETESVITEDIAGEAPWEKAVDAVITEPAAENAPSSEEIPLTEEEEAISAPLDAGSENSGGLVAPEETGTDVESSASPAETGADVEVSASPTETEGDAAPSAEGEGAVEAVIPEAAAAPSEETTPAPPEEPAAAPAAPVVHLSPEEIAILQDLRWLVQEGYVTEFATGELQILGRPHVPPTPKQEKAPKPPRERDERRKPRGDSPEGKPSAPAEASPENAPAEESGSPEGTAAESDALEAVATEASGEAEPVVSESESAPETAEAPAAAEEAPALPEAPKAETDEPAKD